MSKRKSFEEKVKSMTAAQLIRAMIRGLKKEHVKVDMGSFGHREGKRCFGCAATNAVCEIARIPIPKAGIFTPDTFLDNQEFADMAKFVGANTRFIASFEFAIDLLRCGWVKSYNRCARQIGIARITLPTGMKLPELSTRDYLEGLPAYENLARMQSK